MADRFVHHKERVLHRGTGCHTCRQRKVKCDGHRPSCSRCTKSQSECSYDEEIKKSKITLLRDEIAALRSRVHELESDPSSRGTSQVNYQTSPAAVPGNWASSPAASDTLSVFTRYPSQPRDGSPFEKPVINGGGYQPIPFGDPMYQALAGAGTGAAEAFQAPILHDVSGWKELAPTNGALTFSTFDQPLTFQETMFNLQTILPYRLQCAFEIDLQSFETSLEDPDPRNRPHDALLNAIALMACYYNQELRKTNRAQFFVESTRRCLQESLVGIRSRKVVQQIQAGHLLSCYLYWTGSLLEGHAALANAVSLARLCNLHKINSSDWNSRGENLLEEPSAFRPQLRPMPSLLNQSPSQNAIEHGERIHCFWNLLLVDTGGSVSTGYPCQFTASDSDPGTKIDTVYPLALPDYMSPAARAHIPTSSYSDIFQPNHVYAHNDTPLITRIKAALLLHRASRLGTVNKTGPNEEFYAQWVNLNQCIGCFVRSLRTIPPSERQRARGTEISEERRDFLYSFIAWTLSLCAQVVMYTITPPAWRNANPGMQMEALMAANGIVELVRSTNPSEDELQMLDVMVGYSWMTAANFLINMRNAHERGQGQEQAPVPFDTEYAEKQLDLLDYAASQMAKTCRPVVRQAQGTREFRARNAAGPYQASPVQAPHTWNS